MNNRHSAEIRFCHHCGSPLLYGASYCSCCGAAIKSNYSQTPAMKIISALLKCLGFYMLFSAVQAVVVYIYATVINEIGPSIVGEGIISGTDPVYSLYMKYIHYVSILSGVLVLFVYWLIFRWCGKSFFKKIRLKKIAPGMAAGMAVYGVSLQFITSIGLMLLYFFFPALSSYSHNDSLNVMFERGDIVSQFLNIAVMTGIVEEVVFRGLIYRTLRSAMSRPLAVILSATIFGLAHMNIEQFVYTALLGILLALVFDRCGTIIAPITVHIAFNASNFILMHLNFYHDMPYIAMLITCAGVALITSALVFFTEKEPTNRLNIINDK